MKYSALIVGGGIAGIRASLDLAEAGNKVVLIDKNQSLGGTLTQLDRQFPSDRCGMCKMLPLVERDKCSQYCMRKGLYHENIDVMLNTELIAIEGEPGNFHIALQKKPTFVDPNLCIGCGECAEACPARVPDEFNAGVTMRPVIHLPAPYTIPNHYAVDMDNCQRCWACFQACPTGAIDFRFEARAAFKILVADSDPSTGQNFEKWLKDENFPLITAKTGAEALQILSEDSDFHLLLLDAGLPDIAMEDMITRIIETHPGVRVALMAEPEEMEAAQRLTAVGVQDVVAKPLEEKKVIPWLDKTYLTMEYYRELTLEAGAVILTAGFECFNPEELATLYGYGLLPGVVTAMEFERMISGTGICGGNLQIPGTEKPARKIAWLQCVGSREPRRDLDFCSSVCCMSSIKEAIMAKEVSQGRAETVIFYVDMRTSGKDFQRYRDRAEKELGVKFQRCRVHSLSRDTASGGVKLNYVDKHNTRQEEVFDMVVLALGARPPAESKNLLKIIGLQEDPGGFCKTQSLAPAQTGKPGIFTAGSFSGPKDISGSVIQAGAAAVEASRLLKASEKPSPQVEKPPGYRDVSREAPRTLIALCTSCHTLEKSIDLRAVRKRLSRLPGVRSVIQVKNMCTQMGWWQIEKEVRSLQPNRLLLGACMPFAYEPKLTELGRKIELDPRLINVVDIFSPTFPKVTMDSKIKEREIFSALNTSLVKLLSMNSDPGISIEVVQRTLVVGGGVAGMTAAFSLAELGYEVDLIEKTTELGGTALTLQYTLNGDSPQEYLLRLIDQVKKHPRIKTFLNTEITDSKGRAGRFSTTVKTKEGKLEELKHGTVILATGGHQGDTQAYGYGQSAAVITQAELEQELTFGKLDPTTLKSVAMIQCVDSRDDQHQYCSRVCCSSALKNALFLKNKNPNLRVFIFYRDIMVNGSAEAYYTKARQAGVMFIQYEIDEKPRVTSEDGRLVITARDPILNRDIQLTPDLLVLSPPVVPYDNKNLAKIFGVELNQDGFFQEAESKWRPVEFVKQGIFVCGTALSPRFIDEAIASAEAAAARALSILSHEKIAGSAVTAMVRTNLCSLCQLCIAACPYEARSLDTEEEKIIVDELLCQGCGSCVAVCPNSATVLRNFDDTQVMAAIDGQLREFV